MVGSSFNRQENRPSNKKNNHQGQKKSGKQECFVSDAGNIFPANDQTYLIHGLRLNGLKLAGKGSTFHQLDKNFI
jgi:hypothetical protein